MPLWVLDLGAADLAVLGIAVVLAVAAIGTAYLPVTLTRFGCFSYLHGNNSGGNGNDGVPGEHGHRGQDLSQNRGRSNIPITNGGDGHNGPVDTLWNGGESILFTFYQVEYGAQDQDQGQYGAKKNNDLMDAQLQSSNQNCCLFNISAQFEYSEHPE